MPISATQATTVGSGPCFPLAVFSSPTCSPGACRIPMAGAVALLPRAPKCSVPYSSLHDATAPVLSMEFAIKQTFVSGHFAKFPEAYTLLVYLKS